MGRVIKESDTEELELFTVRLRGTQIGHDLMCDRLAWSQHNDMVAISCHGPLPQLKALRASLLANNCMVDFQGYFVSPRLHKNTSNQYRVQLHKHAYSDGHLVAHQDYRGLILNLSDEVLFRMLKEDTYTTPILRAWMPWLREQMLDREYLLPLSGKGCALHELRLTVDDLDEIVSEGLAKKQLLIRGAT